MDHEWSVLLIVVLCFVLSSLFFHHANGGSNQNTSRLPKSPARIPVIGDHLWLRRTPLHQLSSALHRISPKLGSVISLNLGLVRLVFVLDRGLAYEALVQKGALFMDHLPLRQDGAPATVGARDVVVSSSNGAYWRLLRRTFIEVFHPQRLRSFSDARARVLDSLVGELRSQATTSKDGVVETRFCFHHAMSHIAAHMCFGESLDDNVVSKIESARREAFRVIADVAIFNFIPTLPRIIFRKRWQRFMESQHRHFAIINPLISARQEERLKQYDEDNRQNEPTNSYIDSLLNMEIPEQGNRRLSNQEMAALCAEFLTTAAHTTATVMEWVMASLVKYPDVQKRLYQEIIQVYGVENEGRIIPDVDLQKMPYLKAVILETFRRYPPVHFLFPRFLSGDVELGGYHIPKGSVVLFEAGLNATAWEDPYDFKPERFIDTRGGKTVSVDLADNKAMKMMPFGVGKRSCPAMSVAMLHLGYCVANLIREFEWTAVDEVDLSAKFDVLLVMKHQLRARLLPRVRST